VVRIVDLVRVGFVMDRERGRGTVESGGGVGVTGHILVKSVMERVVKLLVVQSAPDGLHEVIASVVTVEMTVVVHGSERLGRREGDIGVMGRTVV
jgi:hypothetical protein